MKKFTCGYLKENGNWDDECPSKEIVATNVEEAAQIFAEQYPSGNPKISVTWGLAEAQVVDNPGYEAQQEAAAAAVAVVEPLLDLLYTVENAGGNLGELSYADLSALIENMREFPSIRDGLSPEECAVREKLYTLAFFDTNLQAGIQTALLSQIASGQPTASSAGAGQSNLARNAAMLGGVAALQKLTQIEENTGDVSEGLGFD
jgi:hypothetical protein